jgi:hypothetical protein
MSCFGRPETADLWEPNQGRRSWGHRSGTVQTRLVLPT